jgi:ATP-dependent RNA helicase RhlE
VNQEVIHVDPAKKLALLIDLLKDNNITRALIFTRTKHGADKVQKAITNGNFTSAAIHGNKSQANREKALAGFKSGKILALVATDIAARGIDVDGVSHVFNYDLPYVPEAYVHRIGRTARAGAEGAAIAFCTPEDRGLLRDIEKTIRQQIAIRTHDIGLKVDPLAPNFGWNPADAKRKSGGGRHMPNAAKKPHRGQGQVRATPPANEGRFVKGDESRGEAPARAHGPRPSRPSAPKRDWNPAGVNGGQVDRPEGGSQRFERSDRDRDRKPFGDRKPFAGKSPAAKPAGSRGPNRDTGFARPSTKPSWMKQVSGE